MCHLESSTASGEQGTISCVSTAVATLGFVLWAEGWEELWIGITPFAVISTSKLLGTG